VLINGRKQGVTKKTMEKPSCMSSLCKKAILDTFKCLQHDNKTIITATYAQLKSEALLYQKLWMAGKDRLGYWTKKPQGLLNFM